MCQKPGKLRTDDGHGHCCGTYSPGGAGGGRCGGGEYLRFLESACQEAIDNILEMAELKKAGQVKKILVTGCMAQRYKQDVLSELPEVDGILGTGSYGDVAAAVTELMEEGLRPCHLGNIHTAEQGRCPDSLDAALVCIPAHRRGL